MDDIGRQVGDQAGRRYESAISTDWTPNDAASVLEALGDVLAKDRPIDVEDLRIWTSSHVNDVEAVEHCLRILPPDSIRVVSRLRQVGYQKRVFQARWKTSGKVIALKQFLNPLERQRLAEREERTFPLAMDCPYVIESYPISNIEHEPFVVEEYLNVVLSESWQPHGLEESVNLLSDLAHALACLHTEHRVVHADIKLDNLGVKRQHFVLLDFGTAREFSEIAKDPTPTGTLKTMAPELLVSEKYGDDPAAADVWAVGALIFRSAVGRYPFYATDETSPHDPDLRVRNAFVRKLRRRVASAERWVTLDAVPAPLRPIVTKMLTLDPRNRIKSDTVLEEIQRSLSMYLRSPDPSVTPRHISPHAEIDQLKKCITSERQAQLLPPWRVAELRARLEKLLELETLDDSHRHRATEVLSALQAASDR